MHTHDTTDLDRGPIERRGLLMWTMAAVIGLAAVVLAMILFWPDGEEDAQNRTDAAPTHATAAQTASAFVDAYSRHDADLTATYLTTDLLDSYFDGLEGLRLETEWQAVTGGETLPGRCVVLSESSSEATVRCPYEFHGLRSEELGRGPYGDNYIDLTVSDGKVVRISDHIAYQTNGFSGEIWEPFARWILDHHPDDVDRMYAGPSQTNRRASEESNRLWEQRTQEYVDAGGTEAPGVAGSSSS